MARQSNTERMAAYRARKKQEKLNASGGVSKTPGGAAPVAGMVAPPGADVDDVLQVEVKGATTEASKLSLKDRILGKAQAQPAASPLKRGRGGKTKENAIVTVLPAVIASF